VVGPERARLETLETRPSVDSDTIGRVLPDAVTAAGRADAGRLGIALEEPVTAAVRAVARREADFLGEVLAPTIGATVRKAVSDAISAMLERLNHVLERGLSLRALRWRIEAVRTQRPFAEIVLLRTLVYRVEQAFLIQPRTGLVLQHVIAEGVAVQDPDQVAALLEAIDSFAREAFRPQPAGAHLSRARVGDLTLWVDRDARLIVAAVVRGVAPPELGARLRETRERIDVRLHDQIEAFRSDVTPFVGARPMLEECLAEQRAPPPPRAQRWLALLLVALCGGLGALGIRSAVRTRQHAVLLDRYVSAFAEEPGVVVARARWADDRPFLIGLRDPAAAPTTEILARHGLSSRVMVSFAPYYALEPALVERRARQALRPPETATVVLRAGRLQVAGRAPRAWIDEARRIARTLPGVESYDDSEIRDGESMTALQRAQGELELSSVPFALQSSVVRARGELSQAATAALAFSEAARRTRLEACVLVHGHADESGPYPPNLVLASARARATVRALAGEGIPGEQLRALGRGIQFHAPTLAEARRVTFRAYLGLRCPELR
jgi:OOP family OmpA-OmpF porin